ncbi:MAG: hypothetical protein LBF79_03765 [Dysgonamonadaceae bacterium]|jgi:hypothetical protein|nr:hypothetical protein [Dysgonamonadaceae bacterium]
MNKIQKYGIGLVLVTGALIMGIKALQDKLFACESGFGWAAGACLFFCVYEWMAIRVVEAKSKTVSDRRLINMLMGLKAGKILSSIFFVVFYVFAVKTEVMRFVAVFAVLYIIFLAFDTVYLVFREKGAKVNKET